VWHRPVLERAGTTAKARLIGGSTMASECLVPNCGYRALTKRINADKTALISRRTTMFSRNQDNLLRLNTQVLPAGPPA